jgi:hypothetical protein
MGTSLVGEFVEFAGFCVVGDLAIPLVFQIILKPIGNGACVLDGKRADGFFDFGDRAHWEKGKGFTNNFNYLKEMLQ